MTRIALLAIALVAGACASSSSRSRVDADPNANAVTFEVDNTRIPSSDITVYLVSVSGSRQLIGSVGPNRTETLRFTRPLAGGQYRLLARPTGGNPIVSNTFTLGSATGVRWSLQSNIAIPVD